jgi:NAD(P)-dependent dehydrogenase (short-subunit alcohol dehydrogenase family)
MALQVAPYRIRVNAIAPRAHRYGRPRYGSSEAELAGMAR